MNLRSISRQTWPQSNAYLLGAYIHNFERVHRMSWQALLATDSCGSQWFSKMGWPTLTLWGYWVWWRVDGERVHFNVKKCVCTLFHWEEHVYNAEFRGSALWQVPSACLIASVYWRVVDAHVVYSGHIQEVTSWAKICLWLPLCLEGVIGAWIPTYFRDLFKGPFSPWCSKVLSAKHQFWTQPEKVVNLMLALKPQMACKLVYNMTQAPINTPYALLRPH